MSGYRFNAPDNLTNNAYVGKMDFHLDSAGKHILSLRGSLAGNNQVLTPQSFPGAPINNVQLNNSRGISALYTAVLSPSMVNVAAFGLTRIGLNQTGPSGTAFNIDSIDPTVNYNSRAYIRISPTYNVNDDFTWTKEYSYGYSGRQYPLCPEWLHQLRQCVAELFLQPQQSYRSGV